MTLVLLSKLSNFDLFSLIVLTSKSLMFSQTALVLVLQRPGGLQVALGDRCGNSDRGNHPGNTGQQGQNLKVLGSTAPPHTGTETSQTSLHFPACLLIKTPETLRWG